MRLPASLNEAENDERLEDGGPRINDAGEAIADQARRFAKMKLLSSRS